MNIAKLRRSLMRSRTPTGAEMKQQNSLEVPPQVRSASFDEMQLKPGSREPPPIAIPSSLPVERQSFLLKVPYLGPKRSKSFDSGCGDVDEAAAYMRRRPPSVDKSNHYCVHCFYLEEIERRVGCGLAERQQSTATSSFEYNNSLNSSRDDADDEADWDDDDSSNDELHEVICGIKVTLSPNSPSSASPTNEEHAIVVNTLTNPRIRPTSPKLERQPAIICMHTGELSSQENSFDTSDGGYSHHGSHLYLGSSSEYGDTEQSSSGVGGSEPAYSRRPSIVTMRATRSADEYRSVSIQEQVEAEEREAKRGASTEVYLEVPSRRDRAASLDFAFSYSDSDQIPTGNTGLTRSISLEPPSSLRSKSIDIELPTKDNSNYKVVVTSPKVIKKAITSEVEISCGNGEKRVLRATCDWSESAVNGDHLWCQTSASGDFCYVGDDFCCKSGTRMKCSACKIICHMGCIAQLVEKVKFPCKPTFRDVGPRQYREHTETHHHWVHRRNQKGKCKSCGKGFQSKLLFGSKEIVAISCSWCKAAFHNKESCFDIAKIGETCVLGLHQSIIVPPSWIVKLPRRGSFKSSLRKSPKKRSSSKRRSRDKGDKEPRPFAIKAIPNVNIRPVIVFINPKSGGNQGAKLMQKFQWLLNPRQVFDLTQGGPRSGLEMFKKVSNLRVLACGGDGTVGWILSVLDQFNINPAPSVGVLPLGTGNDLARALGWGGGYTDEPISKILCNIADGEIMYLDRWKCEVVKNPNYEPTEDGKDSLPLSVVNNYFSFGVDAQIALEFHEAREANPQKFNSRLRNKMFYGQAGGKDLLQRKWKDLCEFCTLECDGKDMTQTLKENKVHAVVFLNIPSYGSGTHPWNRNCGIEQHTDDGLIEVIGLTTYQMPLLQAGGHGTAITQCRTARIVTKKTIPMQVDGEACRLNPSIIEITHLNKVAMVTKTKAKVNVQPHLEQLRLEVSRITMDDYEQYHYDKEKLRRASTPLGIIMIDQDADLDQVRRHINRMMEETNSKTRSTRPLSENWCFVDSCTAERFFRIDRAQEHLHYVTDICTEDLFVLDPEITNPHLNTDANVPVRANVSVDNDVDHTERLALVNDSELGGVEGPETDDKPDDENLAESHLFEKTSDLLLKAAKQGDLKMLKDLHNQGFSLLSIDSKGQTALHHAARLGHKDLVRYLIASAPVTILDMVDTEKGQTALHQAASSKLRTVCCMLVAAGASLSLKDNQGKSARALAQKAEDSELAAYLESQEQFESVMNEDLETTV